MFISHQKIEEQMRTTTIQWKNAFLSVGSIEASFKLIYSNTGKFYSWVFFIMNKVIGYRVLPHLNSFNLKLLSSKMVIEMGGGVAFPKISTFGTTFMKTSSLFYTGGKKIKKDTAKV